MIFRVRPGVKEDVPDVLRLIKELAEYERGLHEVITTEAQMLTDGFGEQPLYGFFVAVKNDRIVGLSLYYWRYSTWKGKRLYLEDIIVTQSERGSGIGKALFNQTMKLAIEKNCSGMMWQVLDWNESAINFYRSYGAKLDNEWINCSLEAPQIRELMKG